MSDDATFYDDRPLPDEHYIAIGKVCDAWARLEFDVDHSTRHLLQTPQAMAACVTAQIINIHPKLAALQALCSLFLGKEHDLCTELASFSGRLSGEADRRNRIVHDRRIISKQTGKVYRLCITAKRTLEFKPQEDNLNEIIDFISKLLSTRIEFSDLWKRIDAAIEKRVSESPPQFPYIARPTDA
jgi:hypothetical protein